MVMNHTITEISVANDGGSGYSHTMTISAPAEKGKTNEHLVIPNLGHRWISSGGSGGIHHLQHF